ncbi:MAG TPA: tetratricopeptide repeat protein, partial [Bdellovibrionales bacterium]|nr:tetratricopeptide repeat protein [Bdellovibrionales bacterium]
VGDERLAEYPTGQWHEVSHNPGFYDKILETLALGQPTLSREAKDSLLSRADRQINETIAPAQTAAASPKEPDRSPDFEDAVFLDTEQAANTRTVPKPPPAQEKPKKKKTPKPVGDDGEPATYVGPDIEVEAKPAPQPAPKARPRPREVELKARKKGGNPLVRLVSIGIVAAVLLYLFIGPGGGPSSAGYIHLLSPNPGQNSIAEKDLRATLKRVTEEFQRDTFQGYSYAQDQLVRLIEGAPRSAEALGFLCLTHRELWPYSFQDDVDLAAVSKTAQMISQVDSVGKNDATCRAVQQVINGRNQEAMSIVDTVLQEDASVAVLYEFKGDLLAQQNDYVTAISYVQKTQQLWPNWVKPYVSEAQYRSKLGQFAEAANMYRQILKTNPKHTKSKILLGIIEFKHFQHTDIAIDLLKTGLADDSKNDRSVAQQGFATLAFAYERAGNKSDALKYAKRAFELNAIDSEVRALIVRLGGQSAIDDIKSTDNALVAMGDQYKLSGNHLAAQAQYKAAFEQNPKNALAALKASQSLWRLNDSHEAIEWVQRAIRANPSYIEAYTTLAGYYVHRYDFGAASIILQKAQKIAPKNYEVYRGWAELELKRNNFQGAVTFAKRALANYDTDMESHLLLVRAFRGLRDFREAYNWSARAIELDQGSVKAQSLYGEVLAEFQGVEAGVQYVRRFVNTYPRITEYKVSLARVLKNEERYTEAIQVLAAATSEEPNNKEALMLMAQCLQAIQKLDDARAYYLSAAALDPSDPTPLFELGILYLAFKKPAPAIQQFQRVQKLNNRYPRTHYFIGKSYLLMGEPDKAVTEALAEKRLNPKLADAYLLAGEARMELKQYNQAAGEFQAALKLRPQGAEIYVKLAKSYRLTGNPDIALQMLRMAETAESGYAEIYKERGAAHEMKSERAEAIEAYCRYLQILPNAPDKAVIDGRVQNLGGGC